MKKTILTISVAFTLGLSSLSLNTVLANSKIDSLKAQESQLREKKSAVSSEIDKTSDTINEIQTEQKNVNEEIKRLDLQVEETLQNIRQKEGEIKSTKSEITKLEQEIKVLIERIEKRNELLKDRARNFQEFGTVSYLDVVLGAQSFGDLIDRVGAVATIVEADQGILREHKEDKEALEKAQNALKEKLANLENMKADLENMNKTLQGQKAEKEKLMAQLKEEEEHMHAVMLDLEEEKGILAAQEKAMQKAIQLEKQRIEAAKRAAAAAKTSSGGSTASAASAPPVSGGTFTKPAAGYLSSGYGNRSLGNHHGVDIAASGTVPIVAAADGVVIRSYYSSSYGNAIFISHSINGQIYTTVYAHMSSRHVSAGEVVSKGQQIGYMGNTGRSYGQHLHFELHRGPWNLSKSNAINPVGIVPL
ncbi:murein hydrolase activator EnvC family protein [Bacillus dakarensis]|uniref:murein hydrolase activator EnvC family protein n=1 Tax=Robertmurraya dakarensis TaxID=1926278 RepID=UPI0009824D38|nr:peptidoglycan DD-metalloendopeptidase family protein [Bacillus dakarensis]